MSKSEDKIIKYLDNQMSESERTDFETELENSAGLKSMFENYKDLFNEIDVEKKKLINQDYAATIIPEFRKRIENNKSSRTQYVFAAGITAAVIVVLFLFLNPLDTGDSQSDVELAYNNLPESELDYLYSQMTAEELLSINQTDSQPEFDSMYMNYYSTRLIEDEDPVENLFAINDIDLEEIEKILSEQELEIVYSQLINKEIF